MTTTKTIEDFRLKDLRDGFGSSQTQWMAADEIVHLRQALIAAQQDLELFAAVRAESIDRREKLETAEAQNATLLAALTAWINFRDGTAGQDATRTMAESMEHIATMARAAIAKAGA